MRFVRRLCAMHVSSYLMRPAYALCVQLMTHRAEAMPTKQRHFTSCMRGSAGALAGCHKLVRGLSRIQRGLNPGSPNFGCRGFWVPWKISFLALNGRFLALNRGLLALFRIF